MMKFLSKYLWFLAVCLFVASCSLTPKARYDSASSYANHNGFVEQVVTTKDFSLLTFQKINNPFSSVVYYIEGDGYSFINKTTVSEDPTPLTHTVLELAVLDKRPNVIYISRPCQYSSINDPLCKTSNYWRNFRMSEKVVDNINQVITQTNYGKPFNLVGYSGGGGIAVLIAVKNPLTKSIITLAANLDHQSFNTHHSVPQISESLNPIDYAISTNKIPQLHLVGSEDKIILSSLTKSYIDKANSPLVKMKIIRGVTHSIGWQKVWPNIIQ